MTTKLIPMSIEEFLRRTTPKPFDQLNRIYHNLTRLLRITALCRRFILRLRKKAANLKTEPITVQELNDAKFYWVKITQQHAFNQEIKQLSRGEHLSNSNPLFFSFLSLSRHDVVTSCRSISPCPGRTTPNAHEYPWANFVMVSVVFSSDSCIAWALDNASAKSADSQRD
ncbi:hypothetical protein KQX54_009718 [Cotesia glomerata]|uniref:Uncharacterized protein n=1 Tax=Cotesia glomerata TaxID=32391 RepID=A0AAV7IX76_COTGL|nr:hypothetical protein KQX54_009718 [Cotesia glomerata]